jgi:hypothetical protein
MVDLEKPSEGLSVDEVRTALAALTYFDGHNVKRPLWTDVELAAMSESELRVAYFTEFYVDEDGWA